jgi:hypothetical protein
VAYVLTLTETWLFNAKEGMYPGAVAYESNTSGRLLPRELEKDESALPILPNLVRSFQRDARRRRLAHRLPGDETAVLTLFQVIFATIASTMTVYLTSSDTVVSEKDSLFPPSNLASKEAAIPKSSSAAPKRVLCKYYRTAVISTHFRKTTPRDPVSAKSRVSLPAMSSEAS